MSKKKKNRKKDQQIPEVLVPHIPPDEQWITTPWFNFSHYPTWTIPIPLTTVTVTKDDTSKAVAEAMRIIKENS